MQTFNHELLSQTIEKNFKNNKNFMIVLNNAGVSIKEDAIKKWRQGNSIPKTQYLSTITKLLDLDISDLLYIQASENISIVQSKNHIEVQAIYAGAGAEAFSMDKAHSISIPVELIPTGISINEHTLSMVVIGNSMEPLYFENDLVFIDLVNTREYLPVNGTYLVRYGDTVQIKDVEFLGNSDILLSSRNSRAMIRPKTDLGLEWEIIGKPFAHLHTTIGSKLKIN